MASGGKRALAHFDYGGRCLGTTQLSVDTMLTVGQQPGGRLIAVAGAGDTIDLLETPLCLSATLRVP